MGKSAAATTVTWFKSPGVQKYRHSKKIKSYSTLAVILTTPVAPRKASGPEVHDQGVDGDGLPARYLHNCKLQSAQREAIVRYSYSVWSRYAFESHGQLPGKWQRDGAFVVTWYGNLRQPISSEYALLHYVQIICPCDTAKQK